jgi:glycosyltransferase involved in cell wall biosynthesis
VRRLGQPKRIDILVKSFRDVANEHRHLDLKIIGCGQEEENLRGLVKRLELEDRVEFLGKQDILTVYSHMRKALIHVCPSRTEGGGAVNLEAQACGCAVIGSRVGGIPEYIIDGETDLLFESENVDDLTNKITLLLNNDLLRNELTSNGIVCAQKFSINRIGTRYLDLYGECLENYRFGSFVPWSDSTKNLEKEFELWK